MRDAATKAIKTINQGSDLTEHVNKTFNRTSEHVQKLGSSGQSTPSEYAGDKLQYGMEDIATETGHIVVAAGTGAIKQLRKKQKAKADNQQRSVPNGSAVPPDQQPTSPVPETQVDLTPSTEAPSKETIVPADIPSKKNTQASMPIDEGAKAMPPSDQSKADAIPKALQREAPVRQRKSISTRQKEARAINQSVRQAERSIKRTQRGVKTAEHSSKVAVKTVQETAKNTQKSAQAAAKTTEKAIQVARAAAKGAAAAAKATVATIKAIIAAAKELVAAIVAGGWISVIIIIVIMLVALIAGSSYGVFFSNEDTKSPMTMQAVVQEINAEYQSSIDGIRNMVAYNKLDISGSRAAWPEVLAVYAVKVNTDPDNPQDVASMDSVKKAMLEEIFWEMNQIHYWIEVQERIILVEEKDEDRNTIIKEVTIAITTLHITTSHKTPEEMAYEYGFSLEQHQMLSELLQEQNAGLWDTVLYGIHMTTQ